jgi:hypothetical protein
LKVRKRRRRFASSERVLWRGTLSRFAGFIRKKTVGILRGEFATSRESLDLGEVQGRYGNVFPKGSKLRRGRAVDPSQPGPLDYSRNRLSGFREEES